MKTRFIQSGFPRSASTLLVNALMGLIVGMQDRPVYFTDFEHSPYLSDAPLDVFKTHDTNLGEVANRFGPDYRLFFIGSERAPQKFVDSFRDHDNVAIFDFENISDATICGNLYGVVGFMAPYVELNYEGCLDRVEAMNRRYREIAGLPFSYTDPFFQLHGSHRSRGKRLRGAGKIDNFFE